MCRRWEISEPVFEADEKCAEFRIWPWNGHRRFAYDLVRFMEPRRIVELGTYWGTSFFAFCQAVKDFHLETECVAVDTWEGDAHTGQYSSEALEKFLEIKNDLFKEINIVQLKMPFKEALSHIEDGSVDLLHIDGCHDYEAIKADYESWYPKLNSDGIVLFHDVADDVSYESVRYWKEISKETPHFTFPHSWGLGVFFPKESGVHKRMIEDNFAEKLKIYTYRSDLEYARLHITKLEKMIDDRHRHIIEQQQLMEEKDKRIEQQQKIIRRMEKGIQKQQEILKRLVAGVEEGEKQRKKRENSLAFRIAGTVTHWLSALHR